MNTEPKKRIYSAEFNMILSIAVDLSEKEKSYLRKAFSSYLEDGLTEWELRDEIDRLSFNQHDGVDENELASLKHKLLSVLGKSE